MIIKGRLVEYESHDDAIAAQMTAELALRLREKLPALSVFAAQVAAELAFGVLDNELEDASSYRWLRTEMCKTMADPDAWDGDQSEESLLLRYIQHLASASHGNCQRCGRRIPAPEQYEDFDANWQPITICADCA